jgi:hypothetical protein
MYLHSKTNASNMYDIPRGSKGKKNKRKRVCLRMVEIRQTGKRKAHVGATGKVPPASRNHNIPSVNSIFLVERSRIRA